MLERWIVTTREEGTIIMADNHLLNGDNDGVDGDDDIFVYTGGDQQVPRDVKRVRIAENVDTIPERTFYDCDQLIEVEGHNRLKKIEHDAFNNCPSLRSVMKMQGVIEIGWGGFEFCYALNELEFDKLEIVGNCAFLECESLRSINMPFIRRVGPGAFNGCKNMTCAVFGDKLERIEPNIFHACTSLRRIVIPLKDNLFLGNYFIDCQPFNRCENFSRVDTHLAGGIHKTISSLHLERWRIEMEAEIDAINQTLPNTPGIQKAREMKQWSEQVLQRLEHVKNEHQTLLKEAMVLLELALWKAKLLNENAADDAAAALEGVRVTRGRRKRARKDRCITSGASIVIKNVLPFLALE